MTWRENCRAFIAEIDKTIPADATLAERKRVLRSHASDFHAGTSWGKQVWQSERRRYLAQHGETITPNPSPHGRLFEAVKSGDVTFPFRGQP